MKKILVCIIVFLSIVFLFKLTLRAASYADFTGGIRDDISADLINRNQSPDSENVISNEKGNALQKRKGFGLYKVLTGSTSYPCEGFVVFREQTSGNDYFIVAHGSYTSKVDENTNTDFITTRTTNTFTDFTTNDKYVYGCNGADANWYYDGTTVVTITSYTVTEPRDALSITTLVSTVTYATCTVSGVHGMVVGDSVLISGATNYTSYNGTFRVTSILGVSSFTYSLSASTGTPAYGTTMIATPQTVTYTFPCSYTHAFFQNRYWVACSSTNPNRIWQSYDNNPLNFDTAYTLDNLLLNADIFDVGPAGERIVKLFPYANGLMVFKSKSIYKIVGDGTPFYAFEITHNLGCNSPNSVVEDNGILYFLGSDSYWYAYDGTSLNKLSENIDGTMQYVNQTKGKVKSITWDTFADFDTGTSTNTNITYDGKITPGRLIDNFNDGDYAGWTAIDPGTVYVRSKNTDRKDNQNFIFSQQPIYKNIGDNIHGIWTFDVYIETTSIYKNFVTAFDNSTSAQMYYTLSTPLKITARFSPVYTIRTANDTLTDHNIHFKIVLSSTSVTTMDVYANNIKLISTSADGVYSILSKFLFSDYDMFYSSNNAGFSYLYAPIVSTDTCVYTSSIYDMGTSTYVFQNFNVIETLNGKTINYYMRSNASSTTILTDSWTSINKNSQISIDVKRYIQWKAEFTTDDVAVLPELDTVIITYATNEPQIIVRGDNSACWFKTRMYCGVNSFHTINTLYNNYTLCYDGITNAWWKFNGLYPYQFAVKSNELYMADARYGVIYKQTSNYNDYSSTANVNIPIDAYYYTNQDYMDNAYSRKQLNYLALAMKSQSTGSLYIDAYINGVLANTHTYSQISSMPSLVYYNRYPLDNIGFYFQWKLRNNENDSPFELFSFASEAEVLPMEISN